MTRRAALGVLPAVALAGCGGGGGAGEVAPLTFWGMSYEGDYAPHLMTAFTAATGIPVEVQSLPWTAAHEKLLTAFAGGALPDVLMLPNGWVGEFAMVGALAPLTDPALFADLFPGVRETTRYAGRDYALPWSVAPQVQFFRRDLLAEIGHDAPATDWAGWRAMGVELKRRRPDDYWALLYLNWWDALFTFGGQTGAPPLRDHDTRGNFRDPRFREALVFYKSLFDLGLAPKALSTEIQDPLAAFAQGMFAIYPSGPSLLLDLHRRAAEIPAERWGFVRMPGPHGPGPASSVSSSIAVSSQTTRPREAAMLLRHMTSPASELRFQWLIGNLPASRRAWTAPHLATPYFRPMAEQLHDIAAGPNIIEWERIRTEVQLIAERVVRGLLTVDAGLVEMDRRVDVLLVQRRALVAAGKIA